MLLNTKWPAIASCVPALRTRLASSHAILAIGAGAEPFNEGASQVKRLINRDRKEFLVGSGDLLDKFTTEFGDGTSSSGTSSSVTTSKWAASEIQGQELQLLMWLEHV